MTTLRGADHPGAVLTEEHVRKVKRMLDAGYGCGWIRHELDVEVSIGCIKGIQQGKTWTHIQLDTPDHHEQGVHS